MVTNSECNEIFVLISPTNPGHFDRVEIYTDHVITAAMELKRPRLILIAVLGGGDYDVSMVNHCLMSPVQLT